MPLIKLTSFVDVTRSGFVTGVLSREPVQIRHFGQQDRILWNVQFVELLPDAGYSKPYTILPVTGLALKVGIGFLEAALLCEQDVWIYDANTNFVQGVLDLDTQAMRDAFTAGIDYIQPFLEFQLTDADGRITPIHEQIFIFRELLINGAPSANPPGQVFLDANELDALYVKRVGKPGEGRYISSPDGTKTVFEYLGDDGSMHYDPVTPPV